MPRARPKFRREIPSVRREALIEATLECLRRYGNAGVSVRRISARAGVSPGLINHHFPSISTLVAAAYESLALSLLQAIRNHAEETTAPPRERLRRFFQASFAPGLLNPQLFDTWLVFWSRVSHAPEMRAVHDRTWAAYRSTLESMLEALKRGERLPPFDVRLAAAGLSALLDGLWVELSLNPSTLTPAEAVALCEAWTAALAAGSLGGLRATRRAEPRRAARKRPTTRAQGRAAR